MSGTAADLASTALAAAGGHGASSAAAGDADTAAASSDASCPLLSLPLDCLGRVVTAGGLAAADVLRLCSTCRQLQSLKQQLLDHVPVAFTGCMPLPVTMPAVDSILEKIGYAWGNGKFLAWYTNEKTSEDVAEAIREAVAEYESETGMVARKLVTHGYDYTELTIFELNAGPQLAAGNDLFTFPLSPDGRFLAIDSAAVAINLATAQAMCPIDVDDEVSSTTWITKEVMWCIYGAFDASTDTAIKLEESSIPGGLSRSPDDTTLAGIDEELNFILVDTATWEHKAQVPLPWLPDSKDIILECSFWSPDGRFVATLLSDGRVDFFDGKIGTHLRCFRPSMGFEYEFTEEPKAWLAWSPTKPLLAVVDPKFVRVYNTKNGHMVGEIALKEPTESCHLARSVRVGFSADGSTLYLYTSDGSLWCYRVKV